MAKTLPVFFEDAAHQEQTLAKIKLMKCPVCGCGTYLICNGLLWGNDPHGQGIRRVQRGQRVLCSKRGRRGGCGRSFSIHLADILPRRSIDSHLLSALLKAILDCAGCVHRAWQSGARLFSLSRAYRLWREFGLAQSRLRPRLCQCTGPPESNASEPPLQLVAHLRSAFSVSDPIGAFQAHFQIPFLPRCPKHPVAAPTMPE